MVSLPTVLSSNSLIPTTLPPHLTAIFAGATSGIGLSTLKTFIKYAIQPRIYLLARNPASAERVIAECRAINPGGEYKFLQVDLSSVRQTEKACEEVKRAERVVNLLILSAGELSFDRKLTPEGLNAFLAASTYTRILIAQLLLPLLSTASSTHSLARVIDVAGGTYEGAIDTSDLASLTVPFTSLRSQLTSMHTIGWAQLAQQAPGVSFIQGFPGSVYTNLHRSGSGWKGWMYFFVKAGVHVFAGRWVGVPIEESGERHVYLATSARYKAAKGDEAGVPLSEGVEDAKGSYGEVGSGVYSVNWDCEGPTERSVAALKKLRKDGVDELVWEHFAGEFERVRRM